MADNVLGLDVNRYRVGVPIKQAKSQGVRFLIAKASEGLTWVEFFMSNPVISHGLLLNRLIGYQAQYHVDNCDNNRNKYTPFCG